MCQHTDLAHGRNRRCRVRSTEQFHHLGTDTFARQVIQPLLRLGNRAQRLGIEPFGGIAIPAMEPKISQDAQIIFADALSCVSNEPYSAGAQIIQPSEWVNDLTVRAGVKRVHGKVTPPRILRDICRKGHDGPTPIRRDILAKSGNLKGDAICDDRHGPMINSCRYRLKARNGRSLNYPLRLYVRREIQIRDRFLQQGISHTATDEIDLRFGRSQRIANRAGRS